MPIYSLHPIFRQNPFDRKEYTKGSKLVILETTPAVRVSFHLGSFLSNCAMGLYGGLEAGHRSLFHHFGVTLVTNPDLWLFCKAVAKF